MKPQMDKPKPTQADYVELSGKIVKAAEIDKPKIFKAFCDKFDVGKSHKPKRKKLPQAMMF